MNITVTLDAVALGLIGKNILVSWMRWFDWKHTLGFNVALDTVLPNLSVRIYEFEIGFVVVKLALIAKILGIVAKIAAGIVEFFVKLLFVGRCVAIDTKVFFGIGKFINLFAVNLMTGFTRCFGMISRQRKSRHKIVIESRQFAALEIPSFGRVAGGAGFGAEDGARGILMRTLVTGLARLGL